MKRTNIFTKVLPTPNKYSDTILSSSNKVYTIDDCDLNITTRGVNTAERVKDIKDFYSARGMEEVIKHYDSIVDSDVPIMTCTEYLKEMKETILESRNINIGNLTRLPIRVDERITVCNVIITDKYPEEKVLLNEVFVDDKYVTTYEYEISKLLEACEEAMGGK